MQIEILLVEDNPGDVRLMEEAFKEGSVTSHLNVVGNGEEALAFLRKQEGFISAPRPDLVILDLNLPRKDGREVLAEIKSDPDLKRIPVVVLTTSDAEQDVTRSYNLHANCYITKPVGLERFFTVIHRIEAFWLSVAHLPPTAPPEPVPDQVGTDRSTVRNGNGDHRPSP
jgi:CheY-like chemotaxis protein